VLVFDVLDYWLLLLNCYNKKVYKTNISNYSMRLINGLEKVIGEKGREKLVNNRAYTWVADIAAINLFSLSFALNEA